MHNAGPSPLTNSDAHSIYPTKLGRAGSQAKEAAMLETPQDISAATEGLAIKDMIGSDFDQSSNTAVWKIFLAAAIGMGLVVLLSKVNVGHVAMKWIALPGDLFIAAISSLIVPMVFCSVVVCIGELMEAGKAASIGGRTVLYFIVCSLSASTIGVLMGCLFQPLFKFGAKTVPTSHKLTLSLTCNSGAFLAMSDTGLVSCMANATAESTLFTLNDTTSFFSVQTTGYASYSVTDQIFGILNTLVSDNIVNAFATSQTLSIITFAVCFGIALSKSVDKAREGDNYPLLLVHHTNVICHMILAKVLSVIPLAIVSMIAGSLADASISKDQIESVGFLVVALFLGLAIHMIGILGTALFITTRRNVFSWLRHIVPAQVFIFGCVSSVAALPVTLRCVESSREVSSALARFVLPLGATSNLNGTAIYMPLACIFMANVSGHSDALTPLTYIMLALVSAISSFGVAPVPHAGLVMMITIWRTVFGLDLPPQAFSILVGSDWFLVRMRAIVNISNDTILCRIIAHQCDETVDAQLRPHVPEPLGTPQPTPL